MAYRDEEGAALARIERLEGELSEALARAGDREAISALHREAERLRERCKELDAESRSIKHSVAEGRYGGKLSVRAIVGVSLSCVTGCGSVLVSPDAAWVLLVLLPAGLLGAGLSLHALTVRWRAGRAAATRQAAARAKAD